MCPQWVQLKQCGRLAFKGWCTLTVVGFDVNLPIPNDLNPSPQFSQDKPFVIQVHRPRNPQMGRARLPPWYTKSSALCSPFCWVLLTHATIVAGLPAVKCISLFPSSLQRQHAFFRCSLRAMPFFLEGRPRLSLDLQIVVGLGYVW